MPLSEQEKRALEELEAQLAAEDPRFASSMVADPHRAQRRRRYVLGALGCVAGVALLVLAIVLRQPLVGLLGFLAVTLGVAHIIGDPKRSLTLVSAARPGAEPRVARARRVGSARGGLRTSGASGRLSARAVDRRNFMATLEERWERRRRESQGWEHRPHTRVSRRCESDGTHVSWRERALRPPGGEASRR